MRQPHNPTTKLLTPDGRKPGRDFTDPDKPLGADVIERGGENIDRESGIYGHTHAHNIHGGAGVADRAHAVAVMRKAEELMATDNPPPEDFRRALELAAGRVGLTIEEYDDLIASDDELADLEHKVLHAHKCC
jgi:hypothetical protein